MTLYDEYRTLHPIAAEPSEYEDIVEAEVKRALEWMMGRDKPLPAEDIKPGRYRMSETTEVMVDVVQGSQGLWVRTPGTYFPKQSWSLPLECLTRKGTTFQAEEEKI